MQRIRETRALRRCAAVLAIALVSWLAAPPHATAQYHPYGPPRGYYNGAPPCRAVNNPWGGAARGAAGGAIIGGIAGDAGRGAAIGAGVGLVGRAIRNSNARANGYCY